MLGPAPAQTKGSSISAAGPVSGAAEVGQTTSAKESLDAVALSFAMGYESVRSALGGETSHCPTPKKLATVAHTVGRTPSTQSRIRGIDVGRLTVSTPTIHAGAVLPQRANPPADRHLAWSSASTIVASTSGPDVSVQRQSTPGLSVSAAGQTQNNLFALNATQLFAVKLKRGY